MTIVELADEPDVVAVVPTLGGNVPRLLRCLESLAASEFAGRLAVVVVWNDPRLATPDLGAATILEPGLNLGFPGALNHARSRLDADFVWVLQDDVVVRPDCLQRLWETMARDDTLAVVSPVTLNGEGLIPAQSRAGVLDSDGGMAYWFPIVDTEPGQLDTGHPLDWVASSAALVRTTAWDAVGGFDPAFYPLLWSDVDFGYRIGRAGLWSVLEPAARIEHEINGSTPGVLHQYLARVQPERFRRKHFLGEPGPPADLSADPRVLASVAQAASLTVVDLATFATALERDSHSEIRRLAQEATRLADELVRMRATVSWRVTAPLRDARRLVRRRR